jgi:hypothetical protein
MEYSSAPRRITAVSRAKAPSELHAHAQPGGAGRAAIAVLAWGLGILGIADQDFGLIHERLQTWLPVQRQITQRFFERSARTPSSLRSSTPASPRRPVATTLPE